MTSGGGVLGRRPRRSRRERAARPGPIHPRWALGVYAWTLGVVGIVAALAVVVLAPPWAGVTAPLLQLGMLSMFLLVG